MRPDLIEFGDRRERMAFDHVRRRLQRERAQHVRDGFEPRLIGIEPLGVALRKLRDFLARASAADFQIAPVIERKEVRDAALDDAQPMLGEPQVGDDLRIEQRDRVGGDRIAEARMKLLGDRCAADDAAPFQHDDLEPGHRQIGGADEAVVPASDDDRVVH